MLGDEDVVATVAVNDLEAARAFYERKLGLKRVRFEHYDFPGTTRDGDVHGTGDIQAAWFKDPDGNILSLVIG